MRKTLSILRGTLAHHTRRLLLALLDAAGYDTRAARQDRLARRIQHYEAMKRNYPTTAGTAATQGTII